MQIKLLNVMPINVIAPQSIHLVDMFHLYGVYRSQGDLYYKMKLGITNERYKFYDSDGHLKLDDVHTGIA